MKIHFGIMNLMIFQLLKRQFFNFKCFRPYDISSFKPLKFKPCFRKIKNKIKIKYLKYNIFKY